MTRHLARLTASVTEAVEVCLGISRQQVPEFTWRRYSNSPA